MRVNRWMSLRRSDGWKLVTLWGVLAALVGLGIAGATAVDLHRALARDEWPVAEGVVLRVEDRLDRVSNGRPARSRVALYAWSLDGRRVTAEQSFAIPTWGLLYSMRRPLLSSIQPGRCRVHYNSLNPAESWIRSEDPLWEAIPLGLIFAAMGVTSAFFGWRMKKQSELVESVQHGVGSLPTKPPGPKRFEIGVLGIC